MLITKSSVWTEIYDDVKMTTKELEFVYRINTRFMRVIVTLLLILNDIRNELQPNGSFSNWSMGNKKDEAEIARMVHEEKSEKLFSELIRWLNQSGIEVDARVNDADLITIVLTDQNALDDKKTLRVLIVRNSLMLHADVEAKGVRMFLGRVEVKRNGRV